MPNPYASPEDLPPNAFPPSRPFQLSPTDYTPESFHRLVKWCWRCIVIALYGYVLHFIYFWLVYCWVAFSPSPGDIMPMILLGFLIGSPLIVSGYAVIILFLLLIYRCWKIIQDGYAFTTPGIAVILMFLPVFNAFWIIFSLQMLARNMNAYCDRYGIDTPEHLRVKLSFWRVLTPYADVAAMIQTAVSDEVSEHEA